MDALYAARWQIISQIKGRVTSQLEPAAKCRPDPTESDLSARLHSLERQIRADSSAIEIVVRGWRIPEFANAIGETEDFVRRLIANGKVESIMFDKRRMITTNPALFWTLPSR